MKDNIKVSVIVPMFNVENYIKRCAISIFEQTIDNFEIIFVNDASSDSTLDILNTLIQQYKNKKIQIKVINNDSNKGLSYTRKIGFSLAKGEFISTIDSDDYIDRNMLETMYLKANANNADIVVCDFSIEYQNSKTLFIDSIPSTNDQLIKALLEKKISSSICNKLIRKKIIDNILIDMNTELSYMEDNYFMLRVFSLNPIIVKVNLALYHYIQYNSNSLTKTRTSLHFKDMIKYWQLVDEFMIITNQNEKFKNTIAIQKIKSKAQLLTEIDSISIRKENAKVFSTFELQYLKNLKKGEKLILILTRFNFNYLAHLLHKFLIWKNIKQ